VLFHAPARLRFGGKPFCLELLDGLLYAGHESLALFLFGLGNLFRLALGKAAKMAASRKFDPTLKKPVAHAHARGRLTETSFVWRCNSRHKDSRRSRADSDLVRSPLSESI
jgi:hypothetical protein